MRTSWRILQDARRALAAAIVFSGLMAVLTLAIPLFLLHALQSAAIAGNLEKLLALGGITAAALITLLALEAVRNALLLRAGLWLDHEFGQQTLAVRGSVYAPKSPLMLDRIHIREAAESLSRGSVALWIDALWAPVMVLALALIHPMFGLLASGLIAATWLLGWAAFRSKTSVIDRDLMSKATGDEAWIAARNSPSSNTAKRAWEQTNRSAIASVYALERQSAFVRVATKGLGFLILVLLGVLGADLFAKDELASPSIAAAIVLMIRLSATLERASGSIPEFMRVRRAWRTLNRVAHSVDAPEGSVYDAPRLATTEADFELAAFAPAFVHATPQEARFN